MAELQIKLLTLVQKHIEEKLDIDAFYTQLKSQGSGEEVSAVLVEIFWLLWLKLDSPAGSERRMRLVELVKACTRDKKVDRKVAMEVLDMECMQAVGLITDVNAWRQKETRYNTRKAYTVTKYNLLREDSEGYAKLLVALNQFGDASLTEELVQPLYKEIQALIGYFDLDPNRVLDLVLDAAMEQPRNSAYLKLVPLFKRDAVVHLLGFKFHAHQKAASEPARPELSLLAASLIQAGLVGLEELLGHLSPSDDDMRKAQEAAIAGVKAEVEKIGIVNLNAPAAAPELPQRGGGGADRDRGADRGNERTGGRDEPRGGPSGPSGPGPAWTGTIAALKHGPGGSTPAPGLGGGGAFPPGLGFGGPGGGGGERDDRDARMAGGLGKAAIGLKADQLELSPMRTYESMLLPASVSHNQKLALAQALLEVGDWAHAAKLMARLGALGVQPAAWGPLGKTLCGIVSHELAPIFAALAPRGIQSKGLLETATALLAQPATAAGGSPALVAALPNHLTPGPHVPAHALEALLELGLFLCRDATLLFKVIRAMRHHLLFYGQSPAAGEDTSTRAEAARVEDVVARVLLPASCLVPCVPGLTFELWELLRLFPYVVRYKMYADLKELTDKSPLLLAASKMAVYETRKVLKRLHNAPDKKERKDACRPHGRLLSKIASANPVPVLETMVQVVEAYANQIDPVVDAIKYLTPIGFDALTFVILTRLGQERDKVKEDGINISDWLQSLAKFTGAVCRKYTEVEIAALCQFLANALRGADSFDLLVLKELVETMTGISVNSDLSAEQLEGTLGGEALTSLVLIRDTDKSRKAWARGARRLLDALQRGAPRQHLALPLLVLVAQQRQAIMVVTEAQHIKFLVELYDKCHETTTQFIEFLQMALPFEDYVKLIPGVEELRTVYKLDSEVVFMAHRPLLRKLLEANMAAAPGAEEGEIEEMEADGPGAAASTPAPAPDVRKPVKEEVQVAGMTWSSMLAAMRASAPDQAIWEGLTPDLFALFWTLSAHDLYVPTKTYEQEMDKARAELKLLDLRLSSARGGPGMGPPIPEEEVVEISRNRDRLKDLLKRMPTEQEAMAKRVEVVTGWLEREKERLLAPVSNKKAIAGWLVQECVVPRLLTSPQDAVYCAKFAALLHSLNVPYFSTVWYYNELLKDVVPALRCITDREAVNVGTFLYETFATLNHWRSSEEVYKAECSSRSGFGISLTELDNRRTTYEQYKKLVHKWHTVANSMFRMCLESSEYTSRRNALTVLKRLITVYPVADVHVQSIRKSLDKVVAEEKREDLRVLARSYSIMFAAEVDKPGRIIPAEEHGAGKAAPKRVAVKAATAAGGSPARPPRDGGDGGSKQPSSGHRLRAEAPEFNAKREDGSKPEHSEGGEGRSTKRVKTEEGADEGVRVKREPATTAPTGPPASKRARIEAGATAGPGTVKDDEDARSDKGGRSVDRDAGGRGSGGDKEHGDGTEHGSKGEKRRRDKGDRPRDGGAEEEGGRERGGGGSAPALEVRRDGGGAGGAHHRERRESREPRDTGEGAGGPAAPHTGRKGDKGERDVKREKDKEGRGAVEGGRERGGREERGTSREPPAQPPARELSAGGDEGGGGGGGGGKRRHRGDRGERGGAGGGEGDGGEQVEGQGGRAGGEPRNGPPPRKAGGEGGGGPRGMGAPGDGGPLIGRMGGQSGGPVGGAGDARGGAPPARRAGGGRPPR